MNKQKPGGIGWTMAWGRPGYTWNPSPGCQHACGWYPVEKGGKVVPSVICYAKALADRMRSDTFYPDGFESTYQYEERLQEPYKVSEPSGIFIDSMGDLMGHWNSKEFIERVLGVCMDNPQHIFFVLTKNFPRLKQFFFPHNVWVGVSSPPDFMNGRQLDEAMKAKYMLGASMALAKIKYDFDNTTFMSYEPLSWDVIEGPTGAPNLSWAIIGAGSNGPQKIQPNPTHVQNLLGQLDRYKVPIYFKENMKWDPIRREFPAQEN